MNGNGSQAGGSEPPALVRRLAGLAGRLPGLAGCPERVELALALGEASGWPAWLSAALALGEIDWGGIAACLRRAYGWTWEAVAGLTLPELVEVLEDLSRSAGGHPASHAGPADGPQGGGRLRVSGASYGPLTGLMMSLLRALWGRGQVPVGEALRQVYGQAATAAREDALEQVRKRLNRRLREEACPVQVRREAGNYAVEIGPQG
jgi:hypothetical protein